MIIYNKMLEIRTEIQNENEKLYWVGYVFDEYACSKVFGIYEKEEDLVSSIFDYLYKHEYGHEFLPVETLEKSKEIKKLCELYSFVNKNTVIHSLGGSPG